MGIKRAASLVLMIALAACATTPTYGPTRVDEVAALALLEEVEPNTLLADCLNYTEHTWTADEASQTLTIGSANGARRETLHGDVIVQRLNVGSRTWLATGGIERPGILWVQEGEQAARPWIDGLPPVAGLLRIEEKLVLVAGGEHLGPAHGLIIVWPLNEDGSAGAETRVELDFAPIVAASNRRSIVAVGRGAMREYSISGEELRRIVFGTQEAKLWPTAALATPEATFIGGGMLVIRFSADWHSARWFIPKMCPDAGACACAERYAMRIQPLMGGNLSPDAAYRAGVRVGPMANAHASRGVLAPTDPTDGASNQRRIPANPVTSTSPSWLRLVRDNSEACGRAASDGCRCP
ncbi:MAG: hypothetical protein A2138_22425 [Deltaproteobacteria bacterium RBG_16_71_12]|nr:MAG: hypothetical protein A2138_22425 [Deltaproteobacteria bacterium RBG_16_71_12]